MHLAAGEMGWGRGAMQVDFNGSPSVTGSLPGLTQTHIHEHCVPTGLHTDEQGKGDNKNVLNVLKIVFSSIS